jgi:chaperonin GroES
MSFTPLHDHVLVRRIDAAAKTAGGLFIPDSAMEKPQEGEVIAVGEGGRSKSGDLISMSVRPGNRILFGKWSGSEIRMDGENLIVMHESDILGVMA